MQKVIRLLEQTSESGIEYYKELDKAGFGGMQPQLIEFINTNVKNIKNTEKVKNLINNTDINSIFTLWNYISDSRNTLNQLLDIFHDHPITAESSRKMSFGYVENLENKIMKFQNHIDEVNKFIIQENILEDLVSKVMKPISKNVDELIRFIDSVKKYQNIELIKAIMQRTLEHGYRLENSKKLTEHMEKSVRDIQNSLFKVDHSREKQPNSIQELLQQFDLVPIKKIDISSKQDLENFAKVHEKYIIAIYKIVKNPKKHEILPLINNSLAIKQGLFQPANTGINPKYIERSKTIKEFSNSKSMSKIEYYGNSNHPLMILETLNGLVWYELKSNKIFHLDKLKPSDLVDKYNTELESKILSNLRVPFIEIMSWSNLKLEESRWIGIRARIKMIIMQENEKKKLKSFLDSSIPIKAIMEIASNDFWENKKITDPAKIEKINTELSLIFISESAFLEENFSKKLEEKLLEIGGNSRNYSNYESALEETLKYFINSKSGLLVSLKNKIEQLEKSI